MEGAREFQSCKRELNHPLRYATKFLSSNSLDDIFSRASKESLSVSIKEEVKFLESNFGSGSA